MTPGLIAGIVLLILLCGSMVYLWLHKPGQLRRKDRVFEDERPAATTGQQ